MPVAGGCTLGWPIPLVIILIPTYQLPLVLIFVPFAFKYFNKNLKGVFVFIT